jgi:hypothetical protein
MAKARKTLKKGGGSASEYGTYVWGTGNQQHAIGAGSNHIAAVNDPTTYVGGRRKSAKKGGNLVNIAVPAVLIAANQLYNPKKNIKEIKKGGADTQGGLSSLMQNLTANMTDATNAINPTPTPTPPSIVEVDQLPTNVTPANLFKGGNLGFIPVDSQQPAELQQPVVVGSGILTDIAAPALLIAANQLYKPKKRGTKKNKRTNKRKSLRL